MKRFLLIIILAYAAVAHVYGQRLAIGIFYRERPHAIHLELLQGKMAVHADNEIQAFIFPKEQVQVNLHNNALHVLIDNKPYGPFSEFQMQPAKPVLRESWFNKSVKKAPRTKITLVNPRQPARVYDDGFRLRVAKKHIQMLNYVDMPGYLAGVVEAESGYHADMGFYKAQAVLARTYTYKRLLRHEVEGFHLCDRVHCQAYKGRSKKQPAILEAVKSTRGEVIVDKDNKLIEALFSANCGGETAAPNQVWSSDAAYFTSVQDTFCTAYSQSRWKKSIKAEDWAQYLRHQGWNIPGNVSAGWFTAPQEHRRKFYSIGGNRISYQQLRYQWKLRSAFFSVKANGNDVILKGRGYGHGAGLCQEGAMQMAKEGYSYKEIIRYYFNKVKIRHVKGQDLPEEP